MLFWEEEIVNNENHQTWYYLKETNLCYNEHDLNLLISQKRGVVNEDMYQKILRQEKKNNN